MSQMPDKIWLHKDTKYNTGDIVSAYQYEFAQEIECEGIENFVEYVPADAFIEKACDSYCRLCDTKECGDTGECDWVEKFRKRLMR